MVSYSVESGITRRKDDAMKKIIATTCLALAALAPLYGTFTMTIVGSTASCR